MCMYKVIIEMLIIKKHTCNVYYVIHFLRICNILSHIPHYLHLLFIISFSNNQ